MIEVSKYLLILLMAVYTFLNFSYFRFREEWGQIRVCRKQNAAMFLLHFVAYLILYLKSGEERIVLFYLAQVVFFASYIGLYQLFYPNLTRILVNNMCMLLCVGWIILTRLSFEKAVLSVTLGGFSFQPSEFVKISFVFFVAAVFYHSTDLVSVGVATAVAAAHVLVLVLSKDLGSALLFFVTYLTMLFVATSNWLYLLAGAAGGCGASVLAYQLFAHVRTRVAAWKNPWADIDNRGYQVAQSLFAIGTGGWFGMGLYQGMPYKIPVVEKDFVFAAISEELGGIFAICVLLICVGCFLQFMLVATRMQAIFYKLIAFGLGMEYLVQVFLTVGGVIKFIPSTGVTLPLVSYGGSSILSTFLVFGVIQGLYILKKNDEEDYEESNA